ncbi:avidin/streptavidin family protein [Ascidiimonas aurantiaca]|uniref:avidin/streptavidin family protein n=1 Tax=Ascidiimonas aurantiaca TaxID=1685432 RepID=UPI0030EED20B
MSLDGEWFNELGSCMTLTTNGNSITGTYQTAVGDASGTYNLVGRTDAQSGGSQAVGFVVVWQNDYGNSKSVTTWSGQYQSIDGEEIIVTTWLLTQETEVSSDWKSTLVNKDVFTRHIPDQEQIQERIRKGVQPSHGKR